MEALKKILNVANLRVLLLASTFSSFAYGLLSNTLNIAIFENFKNILLVGAIGVLLSTPLFGPLIGPLVDSARRKKRIYIYTRLVRVPILVSFVFLLSSPLGLLVLAVMENFLSSVSVSVYYYIQRTHLASFNEFATYNSLSVSIGGLVNRVMTPIIVGVLMVYHETALPIVLAAAMYMATVPILSMLKIEEERADGPVTRTPFKPYLDLLRTNKVFLSFEAFMYAVAFIGAPSSVLLIGLLYSFKNFAISYGIAFLIVGIGGMTGAGLASIIRLRTVFHLMLLGALFGVLDILVATLHANFLYLLAVVAAQALVGGYLLIHIDSAYLSMIPKETVGSIRGAMTFLGTIATSGGIVAFSAVATKLGIPMTFYLIGTAEIGITLVAMKFNIRRLALE